MVASDHLAGVNNSSTRDTGQEWTPLMTQPERVRKLISALGLTLGGRSDPKIKPSNERIAVLVAPSTSSMAPRRLRFWLITVVQSV